MGAAVSDEYTGVSAMTAPPSGDAVMAARDLRDAAATYAWICAPGFENRMAPADDIAAALTNLNAAISAFRIATGSGDAGGWRPISDEAKDGNDHLICNQKTGDRIVAYFDDSELDGSSARYPWVTLDGQKYGAAWATHYRPLPPPPDQQEG
jgi:hypothetical protein